MYKDKYVLTILDQNGLPCKEHDGECFVPFNTEYQIRLKNKTKYDTLAKITIDGKPIMDSNQGVIIPAYNSVDLERWVDGDMLKGKRFRFVPVDDSRVDDPTDSNNGGIVVKMYKSIPNMRFGGSIKTTNFDGGDWTCMDAVSHDFIKPNTGGSGIKYNCCVTDMGNTIYKSTYDKGATIGGSKSNQEFVETNSHVWSTEHTTLRLTLKGEAQHKQPTIAFNDFPMEIRYCPKCGRKKRDRDRFCSKCGLKIDS